MSGRSTAAEREAREAEAEAMLVQAIPLPVIRARLSAKFNVLPQQVDRWLYSVRNRWAEDAKARAAAGIGSTAEEHRRRVAEIYQRSVKRTLMPGDERDRPTGPMANGRLALKAAELMWQIDGAPSADQAHATRAALLEVELQKAKLELEQLRQAAGQGDASQDPMAAALLEAAAIAARGQG